MDISVATSKNVVASIGADKYIRIWEYSIKNSYLITSNQDSETVET